MPVMPDEGQRIRDALAGKRAVGVRPGRPSLIGPEGHARLPHRGHAQARCGRSPTCSLRRRSPRLRGAHAGTQRPYAPLSNSQSGSDTDPDANRSMRTYWALPPAAVNSARNWVPSRMRSSADRSDWVPRSVVGGRTYPDRTHTGRRRRADDRRSPKHGDLPSAGRTKPRS